MLIFKKKISCGTSATLLEFNRHDTPGQGSAITKKLASARFDRHRYNECEQRTRDLSTHVQAVYRQWSANILI
jgi:hypothetical protein